MCQPSFTPGGLPHIYYDNYHQNICLHSFSNLDDDGKSYTHFTRFNDTFINGTEVTVIDPTWEFPPAREGECFLACRESHACDGVFIVYKNAGMAFYFDQNYFTVF